MHLWVHTVIDNGSALRKQMLEVVLPDKIMLYNAMTVIYMDCQHSLPRVYANHRFWNLYTKPHNEWVKNGPRDPWKPLILPTDMPFRDRLSELGALRNNGAEILLVGIPIESALVDTNAKRLVKLGRQALMHEKTSCIAQVPDSNPLHMSLEIVIKLVPKDLRNSKPKDLFIPAAAWMLGQGNSALNSVSQSDPRVVDSFERWQQLLILGYDQLNALNWIYRARKAIESASRDWTFCIRFLDTNWKTWLEYKEHVVAAFQQQSKSVDELCNLIEPKRKKKRNTRAPAKSKSQEPADPELERAIEDIKLAWSVSRKRVALDERAKQNLILLCIK